MTDLEKVLNSIPGYIIRESMEQSVKAHQRPKLTFDEVVAMDLDMVTHNYCKLFGLSDSTAAGLKKRLSHGITVRRQPTLPPANASEG